MSEYRGIGEADRRVAEAEHNLSELKDRYNAACFRIKTLEYRCALYLDCITKEAITLQPPPVIIPAGIVSLQGQIAEANALRWSAERELAKVGKQIVELEAYHEKLSSEIDRKHNHIEELQEHLRVAGNTIRANGERISDLEAENASLRARLSEVDSWIITHYGHMVHRQMMAELEVK